MRRHVGLATAGALALTAAAVAITPVFHGSAQTASSSGANTAGADPATENAAAVAPLAFPGAVGVGAWATGGRGGAVYHVTTLADSGPGSFRDAVSRSSRMIVFDVGGYISLKSVVSVKSNLTIAGQSAPGGGIGVMGREVSFSGSTNVIVRDVRFRQGLIGDKHNKSGLNFNRASNIILDHVSIEFAQWNNIDSVGSKNITVQNSIDADPIGQQFAAHTEGGQYTWYHNLFANAHNRCPLAKADTQFINNVVYNCQAGYTGGNSRTHFVHDVIGNYFISGPRTTNSRNFFFQLRNQSLYSRGNVNDGSKDGRLNGSLVGAQALKAPWSPTTAAIPTTSAAQAFVSVLATSGAYPRDQVDRLVISDVASLGKRGNLWKNQTATGLGNQGFGFIAGGRAVFDRDRDGVPDLWERLHGMNPANAADANEKWGRSGYTNLERYLNTLVN